MRTWTFNWVAVPLLRGLTTLPLALATVLLAPLGLAGPVARAHYRLAIRFPVGVPRRRGVLGALATLPFGVIAFALTAIGVLTVYSGYLYFLRPDAISALTHPFTADPIFANAWGGPTLIGAWFIHSCVAFAIQTLAVVAIRGGLRVGERSTP